MNISKTCKKSMELNTVEIIALVNASYPEADVPDNARIYKHDRSWINPSTFYFTWDVTS